jgi:hypothetical protein
MVVWGEIGKAVSAATALQGASHGLSRPLDKLN